MMARGSFGGQRSFTRPKRRLYEEISLNFVTQSFQAKEKTTSITPQFQRSNPALALGPNNQLVAYGINVPRYDYDRDGNCLGLLMEPGMPSRLSVAQGTNPTPNNMNISGSIDGPGGVNNATRFLEQATSTHHRFTMAYTIANAIGNTITESVIIRPLNRNNFYIRYAAGTLMFNVGFSYTPATNTMVCNYQVDGVTIGRVRYMGNGYWMLSATIINPSVSMNSMYFGSNGGLVTGNLLTDVSFLGSDTAGFDYYWSSICDGILPVLPWNINPNGADILTLPLALENSARFRIGMEFITQDLTYGGALEATLFKVSSASDSGFMVVATVKADMRIYLAVINAAGNTLFTANAPASGLTVNNVAIGFDGKAVTAAVNGAIIATGTLSEYAPKLNWLGLGQSFGGWLRKLKVRTTPFSPADIARSTS